MKYQRMYQRTSYPSWSKRETVFSILLIVLLPAVFGFLFKVIGDLVFVSTRRAGNFFIRPGDYAWFFPGMLFGFGLVPVVLNRLYRAFLQRKYKHVPFTMGGFGQRNIAGYHIVKPFFIVCTALSMAVLFLLWDHYFSFNRQRLVINGLTSLGEKAFPLSAIKQISFVRTTGATDSFYVIKLNDFVFLSKDHALSLDGAIDSLAAYRGLPIDTVEAGK